MSQYVVTFDPRPVVGPGALTGLRRMNLAEAQRLLSEAARIPKRGRIVDAETLEVVQSTAQKSRRRPVGRLG